MSRATQPPRQASGTRRRGLVRTLTAVNLLVGLGVLAAGVLAPWPWQARVCVAIVGVGLLGNALLAAREWSGSPRRGDRVSTRGDATVVGYDRVPAYAAALGTGWLTLVAVLGTAELKVSQILQLGRGAVVELDRLIGEPVDIRAERQLIAKGEVVVVENRLAIQLTEVIKS